MVLINFNIPQLLGACQVIHLQIQAVLPVHTALLAVGHQVLTNVVVSISWWGEGDGKGREGGWQRWQQLCVLSVFSYLRSQQVLSNTQATLAWAWYLMHPHTCYSLLLDWLTLYLATSLIDLTIYIATSNPILLSLLHFLVPFQSLLILWYAKPTGHQYFTFLITVFTTLHDTHILLLLS